MNSVFLVIIGVHALAQIAEYYGQVYPPRTVNIYRDPWYSPDSIIISWNWPTWGATPWR